MHSLSLAAPVLLVALVQPIAAQTAERDGDAHTEHHPLVSPEQVRAVLQPRRGASPAASSGGLAGALPCGEPTLDVLPPTADVEGDTPTAVAFTPDGATIVVANRTSRNLTLFDAATLAYAGAIDVSGSVQDVAITPDGTTAVTANLFEDTVSILDLATLSETATVAVGAQPGIVRITPDGTRAVVGNTVDQSVSVVELATATETQRIPGAGFSATLTLTGESGVVTTSFQSLEVVDDQTAIHTDFNADQIDFFDLAAGTVASVPSDADPRGLDLTPDGATAVVVHSGSVRRVSVVDTATRTITKTVATTINLDPYVAVRPDASRAVVGVLNGVVVVDLVASAVSSVLSTASLRGMDTTADGDYALTYGFQGALVSFDTQSVVGAFNNTKSAYAGAVSPADPRGAMIVNHNAEDLVVVNTNGVLGFQQGVLPTGPLPEADSPRRVAVTPDGTLAVTTNVLSDNASLVDLESGEVLAVVDVGDRPSDVEITPDGELAVVANLDSTFASVIDLDSQSVTNVSISTRGGEVEIAPDGSYAYVAVVVADGVWRIDLDTLTVAGPKLPAGEMGSVFYGYQQGSGMTLSPDGATLVTCNSFDDEVTLIDTASWTVAATVGVGDFPSRATFSPDSATVYVANKTDGTVTVVDVASGSATDTITVGSSPFEMAATPDGASLFVLNTGDGDVGRVDLGAAAMTATVGLPETPQALHLNADGTCLSVATLKWTTSFGPGPKVTIQTAGHVSIVDAVGLGVLEEVETQLPSAAMAFDGCDGAALVPSPNTDRVARVRLAAPEVEPWGCGVNPAGSLALVDGSPKVATVFLVGVDNPLGTQAVGSVPVLLVSLAPDPNAPCGTLLPGTGMAGGGAAGELLVGVLPPDPVLIKSGPLWAGPGQPAPVDVVVPPLCGIVGLEVHAQGVMVNAPGQPGIPATLTEGLRLRVGI